MPKSVNMPAMIGDEMLVPPTTLHLPPFTYATPVAGSATAEMSEIMRRGQLGSFCQAGFGMCELQPLPAPRQVVSAQPRADVDFVSVVPPTERTHGRFAGFAFCW